MDSGVVSYGWGSFWSLGFHGFGCRAQRRSASIRSLDGYRPTEQEGCSLPGSLGHGLRDFRSYEVRTDGVGFRGQGFGAQELYAPLGCRDLSVSWRKWD